MSPLLLLLHFLPAGGLRRVAIRVQWINFGGSSGLVDAGSGISRENPGQWYFCCLQYRSEPPQCAAATVGHVAPGVHLLAVPSLGGGDAIDDTSVRFLLEMALNTPEQAERMRRSEIKMGGGGRRRSIRRRSGRRARDHSRSFVVFLLMVLVALAGLPPLQVWALCTGVFVSLCEQQFIDCFEFFGVGLPRSAMHEFTENLRPHPWAGRRQEWLLPLFPVRVALAGFSSLQDHFLGREKTVKIPHAFLDMVVDKCRMVETVQKTVESPQLVVPLSVSVRRRVSAAAMVSQMSWTTSNSGDGDLASLSFSVSCVLGSVAQGFESSSAQAFFAANVV